MDQTRLYPNTGVSFTESPAAEMVDVNAKPPKMSSLLYCREMVGNQYRSRILAMEELLVATSIQLTGEHYNSPKEEKEPEKIERSGELGQLLDTIDSFNRSLTSLEYEINFLHSALV